MIRKTAGYGGWVFFAGFLLAEALFMVWDVAGRHMVVSDPFVTFISQYYRLNGVAEYGQIPLWTPFMTQGSVVTWWFALQGNSGFLLNAAALLGSVLKQVDFFTLFHVSTFLDKALFLAGVWLLSGRYFSHLAPRVFVMLCVASSFVLHTQTGFGFFLFYAIPLIVWIGHRFWETGRWPYVLLLAFLYLVQAVSSIAYHIPVSLFAIVLYFACDALLHPSLYAGHARALHFGRSFCVSMAGTVFMGLCFLVYLHLAQDPENMINASPFRNADGSMPLQTFLAYAGNTHLNKWNELVLRVSPAWDYTLYTGMFALPFIAAGAFFSGRREARVWGFWSLTIFMISIGSVVAAVVYYFWPLMNYYRHLALLAPLAKLGLCFLAGFGFEALFFRSPDDARRRFAHRVFFGIAAVFFAGMGMFIAAVRSNEVLRGWILDGMVTPYLPRFSPEQLNPDFASAWMASIVAAAACAVIFFIRAPRALLAAAWVWVGLQALDVYDYRCAQVPLRTVTLDEKALASARFQPITWRARRDPATWVDNGRMAMIQAGVGNFATYNMLANFTFDDHVSTGMRTDSWQKPFDLSLRAYFNVPLHTGAVLNAKSPGSLYFDIKDSPKLLKVMGVSKDKVQFFDRAYYSARFERAAALLQEEAFAGDVLLISAYQGRPAVDLADDPVTSEALSSDRRMDLPYNVVLFSPNEVIIEAEGPASGEAWLMYADVWHPAWRASVNGRPAPVYVANLAYKAVLLSAGKNVVRFYFYAPLLSVLQWFFALAALAGLGIMGWACARAWRS